MTRSPFIALLALLCLIFTLGRALGDEGRDGGIVVLPSAVSSLSATRVTVSTHVFGAGEDIKLRLPAELSKAIVITELDGMVASIGAVRGPSFSVSAAEISMLHASGVDSFVVLIVGEDMRNLILTFTIRPDGSVVLTVS